MEKQPRRPQASPRPQDRQRTATASVFTRIRDEVFKSSDPFAGESSDPIGDASPLPDEDEREGGPRQNPQKDYRSTIGTSAGSTGTSLEVVVDRMISKVKNTLVGGAGDDTADLPTHMPADTLSSTVKSDGAESRARRSWVPLSNAMFVLTLS